ncbi:aminoglycoside phosphotransferase family protein [Cellvibrio fontiphilus]|uniref:Aminoglycoside phosphotransferase family protein n=1 Tax=Cellvibrio fontiphilus TaxID=1815559 RepID=A0ABV7FHM8_9GAMM
MPSTHTNPLETIDSAQDSRTLALAHWVSQQISSLAATPRLRSLGSDAGFRRYFRFDGGQNLLAVDAPPATEDSAQFIAIADFIARQGVRSPRIIAADAKQGFLLVEDFGDQLLFNIVNPDNANNLYQQAMQNLLQLQRSVDNPALIPRYDRSLLRRELELFSDWFARQLLAYPLAPNELALLDHTFTLLENLALSQPQVFVHRDYHARNLILCRDGDLGVIDFQGALWGGITYDLVSLLRDCYLRWPAAQVKDWALSYHQQAIATGLIPADTSPSLFMQWFDWLGLQRHIKVLGIFARLNLRDNKRGYLKDLPLVIRYTLEVADAYPELQDFAAWFRARLLPLATSQPWYSDYATAGEHQ